MNILVACEESQTVCIAFRDKGHNAFSCDLQPCSGGHPEWHIQSDVSSLINGFCTFTTVSGDIYNIDSEWDLLIAHPPCTYLCRASAVRLFPGGKLNYNRYSLGLAAKDFFMSFYNSNAKSICIENPQPLNIFMLPPCSCIVQPYYFGDNYSKKTYLWLKNLPILFGTCLCVPDYDTMSYFKSNGKARSKTSPGMAFAMAAQWG